MSEEQAAAILSVYDPNGIKFHIAAERLAVALAVADIGEVPSLPEDYFERLDAERIEQELGGEC